MAVGVVLAWKLLTLKNEYLLEHSIGIASSTPKVVGPFTRMTTLGNSKAVVSPASADNSLKPGRCRLPVRVVVPMSNCLGKWLMCLLRGTHLGS